MSDNILIMGSGHQGLAMAAHLSLNGERVNLWNRSAGNIDEIVKTGVIHVSGVVSGIIEIENISSNIEELISKKIMVTVPATGHRLVARLLAPLVSEDTVIILNPGRTFGAAEVRDELEISCCKHRPIVAATQSIVYTCRRDAKNGVKIYGLKKDVFISSDSRDNLVAALNAIPLCLRPFFLPVDNTAQTSIGNVGMILHCAPVLMNIGWIESKISNFNYYYDGISPSIARFLEKIDNERVAVAQAMGYKLESTADWLKRTYNVNGSDLYECLSNNEKYKDICAPTSLNHRYLHEDIPYGLVPLESAAQFFGVKTPHTTTVINLACAVMETDYRKIGRKYKPGYGF